LACVRRVPTNTYEGIDRFEKAETAAQRENIIAEAVTKLKLHAIIEDEIFYPAIRQQVGKDLMNEADEEHHVARMLIAELDGTGRENDHRDAKFKVLAESVRHHIKEEENEVIPKAKELNIDFDALGQQLLDRKEELKEDGIPADAEHAMVAKARGRGDTPAAAARPEHQRRKVSTPARGVREEINKMAARSTHSHSSSSSGSKGKRKVHKVMKEHKQGKLKSSSGKKVKSRRQAVAVALSEARKSGAKILKKKSTS